MRTLSTKELAVPGLLVGLALIPMLGGAMRLASMSEPATAESARFIAAPLLVLVHVFAATLYSVLGAFQFSDGLRRRWPRWHRTAGTLVAASGFAAAVSGVWMTAFQPIPIGMQGPILFGVRLLVGVAMACSLVAGLFHIARRDIARHEAWMVRAYALGMGAGTQAFVLLPWMMLTGESTGLVRDLLMALAWAINLLVAEWIIRRAALSRPKGTQLRSSVRLAASRA